MPKPVLDHRTLVNGLAGEIAAITRQMAYPLSDGKMNRLVDELFAATTNLTHAPSQNEKDLAAKLEVLCRRLREFLDPDQRGEVLTALLAESIRDDVCAMRATQSKGE